MTGYGKYREICNRYQELPAGRIREIRVQKQRFAALKPEKIFASQGGGMPHFDVFDTNMALVGCGILGALQGTARLFRGDMGDTLDQIPSKIRGDL